ncbi:MAG: hypothetical protein AAF661_10220 [Pseudomonadota bacterium]
MWRLVFAIAFGALLTSEGGARAEGAACVDLDMKSADAVLACVQTNLENPARMMSRFRPAKTCWAGQNYVRDLALVADNPELKKRLSKSVRESIAPPDCAVIAHVVEALHGAPPAWLDCMDYDGSDEHLERCLVGYTQTRSRGDRAAAARGLLRLDCDRMIRSYEGALGQVYDFHFDDSGKGRRLPPGYAKPDCAVVETLRAELTSLTGQADAQAAADEAARRTEARRAVQEKREAERLARAERRERQSAQLDRQMREALANDIDQQILETRRATKEPADVISSEAIRHALIYYLHRTYDRTRQELRDGFGGDAQMVHTANGLRAVRRAGGALITVTRTILRVENESCEMRGVLGGTCTFDLTIGEQVQADAATVMTRALTGGLDMPLDFANRSVRMEVKLQHLGRRWFAHLTPPQQIYIEGVGSAHGQFWAPFITPKWPNNGPAPSAGDGRARSAFLGRAGAPNVLMMHIALGCSHCLTSLDGRIGVLKELVAAGRLRIDLNEVSGFAALRRKDAEADRRAARQSMTAGWVYDCAVRHNPNRALDLIATFIAVLKEDMPGGDGMEKWSDWVYATPSDLAEGRMVGDLEPGSVLITSFSGAIDYGPPACLDDRANASARMKTRLGRFSDEEHQSAPSYFLNGQKMTLWEVMQRLELLR